MSSVKEKVRKAVFAKLRSLRRKLNAQGIPCVYARSVLSHEEGENSFKITYATTADNDDTSLLPKLSLRTSSSIEEFDASNFERGLARIRELFRVAGLVDNF